MLTVSIRATPVKGEIVSGAWRSCIRVDYFERYLGKVVQRAPTLVRLAFYGGSEVQLTDEFLVKVSFKACFENK